jgi:hypothetical protein
MPEGRDTRQKIQSENPDIERLKAAALLVDGVELYPGSLSMLSLEETALVAYFEALQDMARARRKRLYGDGVSANGHERFVGINSFMKNIRLNRPSVDGIRAEQYKDAIMPRPAAPLELPTATPEEKAGAIKRLLDWFMGSKKPEGRH